MAVLKSTNQRCGKPRTRFKACRGASRSTRSPTRTGNLHRYGPHRQCDVLRQSKRKDADRRRPWRARRCGEHVNDYTARKTILWESETRRQPMPKSVRWKRSSYASTEQTTLPLATTFGRSSEPTKTRGRYLAGCALLGHVPSSGLEKRDSPPEAPPDYVAAGRDISFLVSQRVSRILDVAGK